MRLSKTFTYNDFDLHISSYDVVIHYYVMVYFVSVPSHVELVLNRVQCGAVMVRMKVDVLKRGGHLRLENVAFHIALRMKTRYRTTDTSGELETGEKYVNSRLYIYSITS